MVSVLVSGLSGPGSSPGRGHCVVFLGKTLYSLGPLSTKVYKWVPAKYCRDGGGGGEPCDGLASHPGRSRNTPSHLMLQKLPG